MSFRLVFYLFLLGLVTTAARKGGSSTGKSLYFGGNCNSNSTFSCNDGRCIPSSWRCDGDIDCKDEEDEKNCDAKCTEKEFMCSSASTVPAFKEVKATCIPKDWKCDGEFDCDDRSDEKNCQNVVCSEDQFKCSEFDGQYELCIPKTWKCDGQKDCASGADEMDCEKKDCKDSEFQCDNGICIFNSWKCDYEDDCGDNSDERGCNSTAAENCDKNKMFKCAQSDGCIPRDWHCDGEADCLDHSDERNCPVKNHKCKNPDTEFACLSGVHCVSKLWKCDGEEDCPDGSDEKDCDIRACKKDTEFMCSNKICIGKNLICDGREDCSDGGDEEHCASNTTVTECNHNLEYECPTLPLQCVPLKTMCKDSKHGCGTDGDECANDILRCTPGSEYCTCHDSFMKGKKVCSCSKGFETNDNKTCIDINECAEPGTCDQVCHNTLGGYACSCRHGYKLSKGTNSSIPNRCRAIGGDPLVLLSNRATIRQFDLVTNVHVPLIQSPGSAVAMDFHLTNGTLFWSDITLQKILMCKIGNDSVNHHLAVKQNCDGDQSILVGTGIMTPDGLAIDWIHDLLFWTDGGLDQINVLDLNTRKKRTLFASGLEEPRAIAVDPEMGLLFWTEWGTQARIERAGMDGQHRTIIVTGPRVIWPNGLALDYVDKRVYWADAKVKSIFSCDYWGKNIQTVLHSHHYLRHPFSIAVFEDRVYYTDWEHDGVITVNKFTGADVKKVMNKVSTPMTVRIYHAQAQPTVPNKCDNHLCNSICLPRAVYRGNSDKEEKVWHDRPYACACEGTTAIDMIECAADIAAQTTGEGFSFGTMIVLLMLVILIFGGVMYIRQKRQLGTFAPLNFDNPIYRRTVDTEMDDPFRDPFVEGGVSQNTGMRVQMTNDLETDVQNAMVDSSLNRPLTT